MAVAEDIAGGITPCNLAMRSSNLLWPIAADLVRLDAAGLVELLRAKSRTGFGSQIVSGASFANQLLWKKPATDRGDD